MEHHIIFEWIYICKFIQVLQIRINFKLGEQIIIILQRNINYAIEYLYFIDFQWRKKANILLLITINLYYLDNLVKLICLIFKKVKNT